MTTRNILFAALVFSIASKGMGSIWDCTKEDIIIRQHRTGEKVQGKPEFSVMALNACPCFQENVTLDCTGFHTVKSIDPLEVAIRGNQCLLVNGSGLVPYSGASFYYAWDTQFPFKSIYAHLNCSYAPCSKKFDEKDGKIVIKVAIPGTDGDVSTSAQDTSVVPEIMIKE